MFCDLLCFPLFWDLIQCFFVCFEINIGVSLFVLVCVCLFCDLLLICLFWDLFLCFFVFLVGFVILFGVFFIHLFPVCFEI